MADSSIDSALGKEQRPLRSALVYTGATAIQRAIGFLLLPLYTRALDPAEYGTVSVLLSVASVVVLLFTFALDLAIFRNYFALSDDPVRQDRYVQSVWRFLILVPIAGAAVTSLAAWPLLAGSRATPEDFALAVFGAALTVGATTLPLSILRAEQRLRDYLKITMVTFIVTPLTTVLFVVVLDWGIPGWFGASVLGGAASLIAALAILPWRRRTVFDAPMVRTSVLFSLPLLPHTLSHWMLALADRVVLIGLVSSQAVGVYSLAGNIAMPLLVAVTSLNQGFMPTYAKVGTSGGSDDELDDTVVLQVAIVVVACLTGMLLGTPVVELVAPPSYAAAASLVPWIMLGYGFLGLYYVPMNAATLVAGRSTYAWIATVTAAATNLGLILLFVPTYGIKAAAIASAVGYFVLLVAIFIYAHSRPSLVRYRWPQLILIVSSAAATYVLARLTAPDAPAFQVFVFTAEIALLIGAFTLSGIVRSPVSRKPRAPSTT